jgi:hypothetical protein
MKEIPEGYQEYTHEVRPDKEKPILFVYNLTGNDADDIACKGVLTWDEERGSDVFYNNEKEDFVDVADVKYWKYL